ncbi:MAG TPA: carboxypeptidase-like regulatory domain-containing protein [Vicinamibacterales bacterium]
MLGASMVLLLTLAQAAVPTLPSPPGGQSSTGANSAGTGVIKGRVTAADTGRPLRRARITLSGNTLTTGRSTSTNIRGEYELEGVPAGRYQIRVQRSGYLPMQYGQRQPQEPAKPFELTNGQVIEKLDFALPRAGIIAGRVIDETGEAVSGVQVWPLRQEFFRGRRRMVPAASQATTDDIGHYRLLNLPPGEYVLMAVLRETWHAGPERQPFGYAPTFFPGTARAADAIRVKVGVGQEVPNTDFALVAERAATISGVVMGPDGAPLAGARISLTFEVVGPGSAMMMSAGSATAGADGSWRMKDVAPGEYQLEVSTREPGRPGARASTSVRLQGSDIEGVTLVADHGGTITGQVVSETGEALPTTLSRMRVMADSIDPDRRPFGVLANDDNGVVDTDGRFTLTGVIGPSAIRVSALPRAWAIKSIEGGQGDLAETPIHLRGGQTLDVRIVLTNRFPTVTGRITDDRGNPVEGTALLYPSDAERWYDTSVLRSARPDQSGTFRLETVRPGDYLAIALDYIESSQANDPEFLESLRSRATRVSVLEGQPQTLTLRVVR